MGVFYHPSTFLFISILLIHPLFADNNNNDTNKNQTNNNNNNVAVDVGSNINAANPSPSAPAPVVEEEAAEEETRRPNSSSSFKPSVAAIIGALTTLFSITFLLLLYAKHCRGNNGRLIEYSHGSTFARTASARKNSGIRRAVVESLPLFRFSSLSGQKDGLECAVCLTRFEPSELLRLLPKCKHAFHAECVDTWLEAHSTCPLCRYRVDPEDILLIIDEENSAAETQDPAVISPPTVAPVSISSSSSCFNLHGSSTESECSRTRRVSGRHSYAGESKRTTATTATSFRRSLDSFAGRNSASGSGGGCRKDGLLLSDEKKRLEHRIIISGTGNAGNGSSSGATRSGPHQRWSDIQPSDLLYLRSEMIISQNRRLGTGGSFVEAAEATNKNTNKNMTMMIIHSKNNKAQSQNGNGNASVFSGSETEKSVGIDGIGSRSVIINSRSVSEITGLSRFSSRVNNNNNNYCGSNSNSVDSDGHRHQRRQGQAVAATAGLVS